MVNLIDKDFKTSVLKMLKELKENVEKIMYEQNGNNRYKIQSHTN